MELSHYIYGLLFIFVVIIGLFVILSTRNIYKATIASLTSTLGGILVGATMPSLETKLSSKGERLISWLNIEAEYITFTSASSKEVIILAFVAATVLCIYGWLLHKDHVREDKKIIALQKKHQP